jgi:hypothetical protein
MWQQRVFRVALAVVGSVLMLAGSVQAAEVWSDSFESGNTAGEFPVEWNIKDSDHHAGGDTGPRVVDANAADGSMAVKITSKPDKKSGKDGKMNYTFGPLEKGSLTVYGMVPEENSGFLSIELRAEGKRLGNLEFHPAGKFRYRDTEGKNQEAGVEFDYDTWYQVTITWDSATSIWTCTYVDETGETVALTPEGGAKFHKDLLGKVPDMVELRVNRSDDGPKVAYVDGFAVQSAE